jgi:hypothetical protein
MTCLDRDVILEGLELQGSVAMLSPKSVSTTTYVLPSKLIVTGGRTINLCRG